MHQMFVDRIFSKMTPSIKPSCDATNELKATAGYGYQTKSSAKGVIASMIEKKGHCSGEGGYFMSARDFANYVAHFSVTDLIVTKTGHDAMFTEGMTPDDRLVWTAASGDNWMKEKFQMPVVVWNLDRWGRSVADLITTLAELRDLGIALVSLTATRRRARRRE